MNGWTKFYGDGTALVGSDEAVALGNASWSKSQSFDMVGAALDHKKHSIAIYGAGEYWQADRYIASLAGGPPELMARMLGRCIDTADTHFRIVTTHKSLAVVFNDAFTQQGRWVRIQPHDRGKWLFVQLDVRTSRLRYYIQER
jgi:hypothetical protein